MTRRRLDAKDVRVGDRVVFLDHLRDRMLLVSDRRVTSMGNVAIRATEGDIHTVLYRRPHELVIVERDA